MSETREHEQSEKARRANRLFEERIGPALSEETPLRAYVAIDTESGDYEVEERDKRAAIDRLRERRPEASVWVRRVGSRAAHRFGGGRRFEEARRGGKNQSGKQK
jgi:hypothetical protein